MLLFAILRKILRAILHANRRELCINPGLDAMCSSACHPTCYPVRILRTYSV